MNPPADCCAQLRAEYDRLRAERDELHGDLAALRGAPAGSAELEWLRAEVARFRPQEGETVAPQTWQMMHDTHSRYLGEITQLRGDVFDLKARVEKLTADLLRENRENVRVRDQIEKLSTLDQDDAVVAAAEEAAWALWEQNDDGEDAVRIILRAAIAHAMKGGGR